MVMERACGTRGNRRNAHPRRRLRGELRRAAAGAARRDDRQPRKLHALHADAARGGLGDDRAASRRRPAPADVPARRAPARHCAVDSTRKLAPRRWRPRRRRLHTIEWRNLVVALGAVSRTLPIPGLAEHGRGFKDLADAIALRNHVLRQLEAAAAELDAAERERQLGFVFVGAGYAGVEALAELQRPRTRRAALLPAAPGSAPALGPRRRRAENPSGDPDSASATTRRASW